MRRIEYACCIVLGGAIFLAPANIFYTEWFHFGIQVLVLFIVGWASYCLGLDRRR